MKKYLLSLSVLLLLNACGPSTADVAGAEQAGKEELLRQQEHEKEQRELKDLLITLKSQLAGEEEKLRSIEKFQLLRTSNEKAQQVADQTKIIERTKMQIDDVQNRIDN